MAEGNPPNKSLIEVFAVREVGDDEPLGKPIMDSWELLSLSGDGFELRFNFTEPLMISGGDEPDMLLI